MLYVVSTRNSGIKRCRFELDSEYARSGQGRMLMNIFREQAAGYAPAAEGAAADPPDAKAKYESFSQLAPGIVTLDP